MVTVKMRYDFLRRRVSLSWRDVKFGLDHQLIAPQVAIDKAADQLERSANVSPREIGLATRLPSDPLADLVEHLVQEEGPTEDDVQAKWLYLVMAWLFENRDVVSDPLAMVEELYADFDYPNEIAPFVRYMPMVGPDLGSLERNTARLYDYWESYLDMAARRFGPSGASE